MLSIKTRWLMVMGALAAILFAFFMKSSDFLIQLFLFGLFTILLIVAVGFSLLFAGPKAMVTDNLSRDDVNNKDN